MRWAIVIAASTMLGSCSAADDKGAKERQVAGFHSDYDAERFAAIYDAASPSLKAITPKPAFLGLLDRAYRGLGPVESAEEQSWKIYHHSGNSQAVLVYETTFAKGTGTETFLYEPGEGDGVDAPRRHRCAKVEVLITT